MNDLLKYIKKFRFSLQGNKINQGILYSHLQFRKKILIVVWYMNDNELEETKARGKETSYNALAEIQGRNVDGWKKLVEIGRESNE